MTKNPTHTITASKLLRTFIIIMFIAIAGFGYYVYSEDKLVGSMLFAIALMFLLQLFMLRVYIYEDRFEVVETGLKGFFGKKTVFKYSKIKHIQIVRQTPQLPKEDTDVTVSWRDNIVIDNKIELAGTAYDRLEELIKIILQKNPEVRVSIRTKSLRENVESNLEYNVQRAILQLIKK